MRYATIRGRAALVLGVLLSIAPDVASAQVTTVSAARERAHGSPQSVDAALAYARTLRVAGRESDALVELRRASTLGGTEAVRARVAWEIARTHIARRAFESAMATCRSLVKAPPATTAASVQAVSRVCAAEAHLLWRRGSEALAEVDALAKLGTPAPDVAYFGKLAAGRAHELAGRDADAEASFREAVDLDERRPDGHVLLGALLERTGRSGVAALRRAVELAPHDPDALLALGRALPPGAAALDLVERATQERPTLAAAHRALAEAHLAAGRVVQAKVALDKTLELEPNDVPSKVMRGRLALDEGRVEAALEEAEAAAVLAPNAPSPRVLVADAFAKKGETDLALEAYQVAIGLDRADPAPLVSATNACLAAGRVTSAKAFARRASADFPDSAAAWMALGDALAMDGDVAGARAAFERARATKGVDAASVTARLAKLARS